MNCERSSRKDLFKRAGALGITAIALLSLLTTSCGSHEKAATEIELKNLIEDPQMFLDQKIETTGYPEYVGEEKYSTGQAYYDVIFKITKIRYVSETLAIHNLHMQPTYDSPSFTVAEKKREDFLPVPAADASEDKYPMGENYKIIGTVRKTNGDEYYLRVSEAKPLETSSASN